MVREGFAHEFTYDRAYRYRAQLRPAQRQAKEAGLGFWSQQTCFVWASNRRHPRS